VLATSSFTVSCDVVISDAGSEDYQGSREQYKERLLKGTMVFPFVERSEIKVGLNVLPQGVAHQAARRVFLVCVKNRFMPRELAASVLPALGRVFHKKPLVFQKIFTGLSRSVKNLHGVF
jgi:hypothetical protein